MTERALANKTAFVSGSGRNIGRAVSIELAKLGCNIVINGATNVRDCEETSQLVNAHGVKSLILIGDMANPDVIKTISQKALDEFGTVDVLINNAAIRPHKPFLEMSDSDWHSVMNTSLTAAFHTSQAFLPGMADKGWGRIISMTGMKAIKGYFEGAPISAAKHGIWGLTKALATEFGPQGITANAVSPGQTKTGGRDGKDPKALAGIPVGFMGEPEDIAALVTFLASPASRFVNGQMIGANGGQAT